MLGNPEMDKELEPVPLLQWGALPSWTEIWADA